MFRDRPLSAMGSCPTSQESGREGVKTMRQRVQNECGGSHLVEDVKKDREADGRSLGEVIKLKEESERVRREIEQGLREEVQQLRAEVDRSNKESEGAIQTAK